MLKKTPQTIGHNFENYAAVFLKNSGLKYVERNYRCRVGEIDLVMLDRDNTLVFVEVRYRHSNTHGDGAASVTFSKQNKLRKAALFYLTQKKLYEKQPCRFDVLAISGENQIEWLKNAF